MLIAERLPNISSVHISFTTRNCPKMYSNTVLYINLFLRITPANPQLIEFCLLTKNSPDITLCGWLGSKHQLTNYRQKNLMSGKERTLVFCLSQNNTHLHKPPSSSDTGPVTAGNHPQFCKCGNHHTLYTLYIPKGLCIPQWTHRL